MKQIFIASMPAIFAAAALSAQILPPMQSASSAAPAAAESSAKAPAKAAAPASAGGSNVSLSPSTSLDSGTLERTQDKLFDVETDSIDFENGSFKWKGRTFDLGSSRIVRARFERYLAMDLSDQNFDSYQKILKEITASLAPSAIDSLDGAERDAVVRAAWSKLYDAAEYDIDNDGCIAISNCVYQVWRMAGEYRKADLREKLAAREAKKAERETESLERKIASDNFMAQKRAMETPKQTRVTPPVMGANQVANQLKALAEAMGKKTLKEAEKTAIGAQAILQFQSQTMSFLTSRRFQHATISAYFYRILFKGNFQNFEVGKDEFAKFYPVSNMLPTNDLMESLATEARNDVRESMISVNSLYDSGQRYSALMRLMETFMLGENEPSVRAFDFEKKKVLHAVYRDMILLKDLADNRDLAAIEETLQRISAVANDFPSHEAYSKIRIAKQASNLKIMQARAAAFAGNLDEAKTALEEAATIWPLNPELDKFTDEVMKMSVGASKYISRFDELVERQNYREIMDSAAEFGIALRDNPEKIAKLKEIVGNVSQIDFLIAQAQELNLQGNSYVAWELLEKARSLDAADPILARAMASLAPTVADYVRILDKARAAEKSGRGIDALNLYLRAQDIFPTSQTCREGIERVSNSFPSFK